MSDQPRDLAAEVERVATFWGERPEIKTLLQHIAALARELEEHREALRWALDEFIVVTSDGMYTDGEYYKCVAPPAHLSAVLAKAMEGK